MPRERHNRVMFWARHFVFGVLWLNAGWRPTLGDSTDPAARRRLQQINGHISGLPGGRNEQEVRRSHAEILRVHLRGGPPRMPAVRTLES
ncbi:hypothetical protein ACFRCI_05315 [Streptomyces sp. NPDC056638]|uniref:hypothetical protein n=1 Tax=Streptomyces sp. NPDC056638 TaxID=3345887 RepID=UPI00368580A0